MSNLNNKKIRLLHYSTYGKGNNPKLTDDIVMDYDPEKIKEWVNEISGLFVFFYNKVEDFIQGKINILNYQNEGGCDWNEPTGGYFVIQTYEEAIEVFDEQIKKFEKEKKKLAKKFGLNN